MNVVDKVINVALNEVGYLEKKSNYELDDKYANVGNNNYTKYGRDMHSIYPSVMDFPAPWCDCFVDWCFYKAYGIATAKSLLDGNFDDYTVASAQMYKNKNALDSIPTRGSQVFFTKNGQVSGCYHTGLVYQVDTEFFYTVEGNTSGASGIIANGGGVAKKRYSIQGYKNKVIFGHPNYSIVPVEHPLEPAKHFDKSISGTYRAKTNVNMRVGAGVSKKKITQIKKGETVKCYGYYNIKGKWKWLLVTYKSYTGYVCIKRLKK